jgi:hypothetical protein
MTINAGGGHQSQRAAPELLAGGGYDRPPETPAWHRMLIAQKYGGTRTGATSHPGRDAGFGGSNGGGEPRLGLSAHAGRVSSLGYELACSTVAEASRDRACAQTKPKNDVKGVPDATMGFDGGRRLLYLLGAWTRSSRRPSKVLLFEGRMNFLT